MHRFKIAFIFLFISLLGFHISNAQIALSVKDTTVCENASLTLSGSVPNNYKVDNNIDDLFIPDTIDIGFPFVFYGDTVEQFLISTNNFISFDLSLAGTLSQWLYKNAADNGELDKVIMFPFQDVDFSTNHVNPNPGIISYQSYGVAPNRKFVIEFCSVPLYGVDTFNGQSYDCGTLMASDQLILYEGSNIIEMHIQSKPFCQIWPKDGVGPTAITYPGSAVQGLRKVSGSSTYQDLVSGRNNYQVGWTATNSSHRFTPNGSTAYSISSITYDPIPLLLNIKSEDIEWYQAGRSSRLAKDSSININASASVPYYVAVVSGEVCNTVNTITYRDTIWVHTNNFDTTILASICEGRSYTMNGKQYTTTGFYSDTLQTIWGCDSILFLNLKVGDYQDTIRATICPGGSYTFGGKSYSVAGNYTDTFQSLVGCDSFVTLNLFIGQTYDTAISKSICAGSYYRQNGKNYTMAGIYKDTLQSRYGCDSVVTLNLSLRPVLDTMLYDTICSNESILFGSRVLRTAGVYQRTLVSSLNCDSIVKLTLTVHLASVLEQGRRMCPGDTIIFNGKEYTDFGTYSDTFKTVMGCDSITTIHIISARHDSTVYMDICPGDSVLFNGTYYSKTGLYSDSGRSVYGCDSITRLMLTVNPEYDTLTVVSICQGKAYRMNGKSYTATGYYVDTLQTRRGCDSIVRLDLTVIPKRDTTLYDTACADVRYYFGTARLTRSGTYTRTIVSSLGCDSLITLHFVMHPTYRNSTTVTICLGDSTLFHGKYYRNIGTYTDTFKTINGCDSLSSLVLRFGNTSKSITGNFCPGDSFLFHGKYLNAPGIYRDTLKTKVLGCDSVVILNLKSIKIYNDTIVRSICQHTSYKQNGNDYSTTGVYTDSMKSKLGCDSIMTVKLTVFPVKDTVIADTVCSDVRYFFGSNLMYRSGTYIDTFKTYLGCDSIVTLNLVINPSFKAAVSASICPGDSFLFNNRYLQNRGVYSDTFKTMNGCDSIITLSLSLRTIKYTDISEVICLGDTFNFNGKKLYVSGIYIDSLISSIACDSVVTLDLTVNPSYNDTMVLDLCPGDTVFFVDSNYFSTGIYTKNLITTKGCDSIVTLNLTIHDTYDDTTIVRICPSVSYTFNGKNYATEGFYTDSFKTIYNCDSVTTLHLIHYPTYLDTIYRRICDGGRYKLGDNVYRSTGNYIDTFKTILGCDSVISLYLYVSTPPQDSLIEINGCGPYTFEGKEYTQNTSFVDTILNFYGCDSIYRFVRIKIWYPEEETRDSIGCDRVRFLGKTYGTDTMITEYFKGHHGCDSFILNTHIYIRHNVTDTLYADICIGDTILFEDQKLYKTGVYAGQTRKAKNGCDSDIVFVLSVHQLPSLSISVSHPRSTFCIGDEITLSGKGATQYYWWTEHKNDFENSSQIRVVLNRPYNQIWMRGVDNWGCVDTTNIGFEAEPCCDIFMPNAFTPNGDGLNDKFGAETNGHPATFRLMIFDRWGKRLFVGNQPKEHWDGTYNGKQSDLGTYYYYLSGTCVDGTPFKMKGTFMLVR